MRFVITALLVLAATPLAAQTPVVPGQTVRGTLDAGDPRMDGDGSPVYDAYVIQGRPGTRLRVFMKSYDFMPVLHWGRYENDAWTELDPDGGEHSAIDSERMITLDAAGRYELRAAAWSAREPAGAYELQISDLALLDGVPLALGQLVEGDLTPDDFQGRDGPEDHYVITGRPGQTVTICADSYDFDAEVRFGPWRDGALASAVEDGHGGMGANAWLIARMDEGGEHHVIVSAFLGDTTGEYILRAMDGAVGAELDPEERGCVEGGKADFDDHSDAWRDRVEPLESGQTIRRSLGPASEKDASGAWYRDFSYTARAGETLMLMVTSREFDPSLAVGTGVGERFAPLRTDRGSSGESSLVFTAERDGEHTIRVFAPGAARAGSIWVALEAGP